MQIKCRLKRSDGIRNGFCIIQNPFFVANRLQTALLPYPDLNLTCHTNRLQTALFAR
ncbi:hypothetical protein NMH_1153 [Neisseria meningitidis H44/76]|uniref:Uncharacterized protein n=2 Tax=Neisseria meningitidis serogroup B TaxID=491 RepID=E6MWW0_NEIMH|nr:hypothetical protein NMH_1153 [Neisseria meningitidis H44/76]